ncbi:ABC transporter permease [Geomicrobium sp. JCM 19039]|uniref:ABC transporter permease n=1 Tax=Geomicrobium sp. JCM 19039 TaxID=1460636 RepID=UPI0005AB74C3|nr:sugar ABC transporter permease [Geomicrobium sp. JCM 19039]
MVIFVLFVGTVNDDFLQLNSMSLLLSASIILFIMAIGQSFVLITSNIDVSVGSTMGLSAAVCGTLLMQGVSTWIVFLTVIAVGATIGLLNGIGVSFLKIPAIIMTLGMLGMARGAMLLYTEGMWIDGIPNSYKQLARVELMTLPLPVWVALAILLISYLLLTKTKRGRYFYAVGDNAEGAKSVGLPVRRVTLIAFMISSVSASIAGLIFVMNIGFVPNTAGSGLELQVIAAAVLGGVSLTGGVGSVVGAALGAVFFTIINQSLVYLMIPAYWTNAISGLLLLIIVIADTKFQTFIRQRAKKRVPKPSPSLKQGVNSE